jgi:hypothetical protein
MAAPNMRSPTTITGKVAGVAVGNTATTLVANAAASGKIIKLNSIQIANINTGVATVDIDIYKGNATAFRLAKGVSIPANSAWQPAGKLSGLYLEENDTLRATASAASYLEAVVSYEEIS